MNDSSFEAELRYLRGKLDELWSKVYESERPGAAQVARLEGWKEGIDRTIGRIEKRLDDLMLPGIEARLDRIECRIDSRAERQPHTAPHPSDPSPCQ